MPFATEMFAHFVYSPDLSYDELLETEKKLMIQVEELLRDNGGQYIDYEAIGDAFQVQCSFEEHDEDVFQSLCRSLLPLMDGDIEVRLAFVRKDISIILLYFIADGEWRESPLHISSTGFDRKKLD